MERKFILAVHFLQSIIYIFFLTNFLFSELKNICRQYFFWLVSVVKIKLITNNFRSNLSSKSAYYDSLTKKNNVSKAIQIIRDTYMAHFLFYSLPPTTTLLTVFMYEIAKIANKYSSNIPQIFVENPTYDMCKTSFPKVSRTI
jgi:hypothetical protein